MDPIRVIPDLVFEPFRALDLHVLSPSKGEIRDDVFVLHLELAKDGPVFVLDNLLVPAIDAFLEQTRVDSACLELKGDEFTAVSKT